MQDESTYTRSPSRILLCYSLRMNEIHRALLMDQMGRDTLYCTICGMRDVTRPAIVRYTVANDALKAEGFACRDCFNEVLRTPSIPVVSFEPVTQPAYIELLAEALL
jgi:hypothetical protein